MSNLSTYNKDVQHASGAAEGVIKDAGVRYDRPGDRLSNFISPVCATDRLGVQVFGLLMVSCVT